MVEPSERAADPPNLLPWVPSGKQTAALPPSVTPPQPEPSVAPLKPAAQPKPDLQGKVSAVVSTSRIRIGEHWVELYGINDPTEITHTQEMTAYLKPSGGLVECYQKPGGKYQCYAAGKDLALLALGNGLARATTDAPTEYRSLSPSPMPDRR
jgi:uncharacterized protein YcfJ